MIVKIEFNDDLIMLFGNSYKDFDDQLEEYVRMNRDTLGYPAVAWQSKSKWIGWGGLWSDSINILKKVSIKVEE